MEPGQAFAEARERALSRLRDVSLDKAPAGGVDTGALAVVQAINDKAQYVTTSSCAGRCAVYAGDGKRVGRWLWLSHDAANESEIEKALNEMSGDAALVTLKFEPPILHVRCADLRAAEELTKTALTCGFRESGTSSLFSPAGPLVAIRSTAAALEVPLGQWSGQNWQWRASNDFVKNIVVIAGNRLESSRFKLDRLVNSISLLKKDENENKMEGTVSLRTNDANVNTCNSSTKCVVVTKSAARRVKLALGSKFNKEFLISDWGVDQVAIPFLGEESQIQKLLDPADEIQFIETNLRSKHAKSQTHKSTKVNIKGWKRLGSDALLVPSEIEAQDWKSIAAFAKVKRLFRDCEVDPDETRPCRRTLLFSSLSNQTDTWVTIKENGLSLSFDAASTMFCFGNAPERLRHASFDCRGQTVVDLYAGIGYFTLPMLKAGATFLHACEWSPITARALRRNLQDNGFAHKVTVYEMDNQLAVVDLKNIAHRISLGLTPSCRKAWPLACDILHSSGGFLHIHENHKVLIQNKSAVSNSTSSYYRTAFNVWGQDVACHINTILQERRPEAAPWETKCIFVSKVKSYAPHVFHLVADLHCVSSSSTSFTLPET